MIFMDMICNLSVKESSKGKTTAYVVFVTVVHEAAGRVNDEFN